MAKDMKLNLGINTTDSFTTADGTVVSYRDIFDGILTNANYIAAHPGMRLRTDYTDGDPDFESSFYLLKHTYAAAVLTENLFYDNPDDLAFLESPEGQKAIVALHVEGIIEFLKQHDY